MKTTSAIRTAFLDFFAGKGHALEVSSPLVPRNDPTLLFTNAGMVQFKDLFTGLETRDYVRAATSQKCLRAGGKHNDLENVGFTARHHTFFEMLGNFSFGDYFKEEAISYAWELVSQRFELPKDRLLVTVYADDEEAAGLWKKVAGFSDDRIIRIATQDNFWSMGDTGPCGPCTEIFYDHGDNIPGGPPGSADEDGDRFVEIWNLVFMQLEKHSDGSRTALPKPSVDTGMGLERITAVLQGVHNNYDIDLFQSIIKDVEAYTSVSAQGELAASHRVIADHLRASSFLISDGVLPSNEGRGYVLRRIMRRAMRHAYLLGAKDPLLCRLVPVLLGQMGAAFPELNRAESLVTQTLRLEEERFREMLERGLRLLQDETGRLGASEPLSGDVAFKLYDTFGFPLDLTQDALKSEGRAVDEVGFQAAMLRQRQESRKNWSGSGDAKTEQHWYDIVEQHGATEFLGYDTERAEAMVVALVKEDHLVLSASEGEEVFLITNQTPFYGESGGQMGDAGVVHAATAEMVVSDTGKKLGKLHVHQGRVVHGTLWVGEPVSLEVDAERRQGLRQHHSATHLLHAALRNVFGDHVTQKGSLVSPDRLRFDFSHIAPLSQDERRKIEDLVIQEICRNTPVETQLMSTEKAMSLGAMALFGEKYADEVRVVTMGGHEEAPGNHESFSFELCGGTHARRTGDLGYFRIVSEAGVSSGVRRIEAVVGRAAQRWVDGQVALLSEASDTLKSAPGDLSQKIKALQDDRKRLEQELNVLRQKMLSGEVSGGEQSHVEIKGVTLKGFVFDDVPAQNLRGILDDMKKGAQSQVFVVASRCEDKVSLVVGTTSDLAQQQLAVPLVQTGSMALGGKGGGGRGDFAQGGGPNSGALPACFERITEKLKEIL